MSVDGVRREVLGARRALPAFERAEASKNAVARCLEAFGEARGSWRGLKVALYRSMPDELSLSALVSVLRREGALLHFPRVQGERIEMARVDDPDLATSWDRGPFGIDEPAGRFAAIDPKTLDIVFVPGVAFGVAGERIGMGAGFYDRFLASAPDALRIALAFDAQLRDGLPQNSWDERVHWVLTERREVRLEPVRRWFE